jgi:uncharacterized protein with von Willebrand factor type A (vWA) domain
VDLLFDQMRRTTKAHHVTDCLEVLSRHYEVAWVPVGGRDNMATINMGRDPAAGLIERVTNAVDAVLEQAWVERLAQKLRDFVFVRFAGASIVEPRGFEPLTSAVHRRHSSKGSS